MTVQANATARESAESIVELIQESLAEIPEECHGRFWSVLFAKLAPPVATEPAGGPDRMSDEQARSFGCVTVPDQFRKYAGQRVDSVDLSYWFFIVNRSPFVVDLERYLRSDRIRREQDNV